MSEEAIQNDEKVSSPGGFLPRLINIFISPRKVFSDVDRGAPWWEPFVWTSLVNMIVAYILIPVQIQLFRLRGSQMPKEQFDRALERMQSVPIKYLGIISAPVTVLFVAVIFSAVSYIAVSALSEKASYKKHLAIYLWASVVASFGVFVSNVVVRLKGIENIRTFHDAMAPFGPAAFVAEGNKILYAVLSTLDIFSLWFYVLVVVGVTQVFRMSGRSALLVILPIWLLSIVVALVGARFGGAM